MRSHVCNVINRFPSSFTPRHQVEHIETKEQLEEFLNGIEDYGNIKNLILGKAKSIYK